MGQVNETIRSHVQRQFTNVKKSDKREYLVIEEAKKLQSLDEYPIDFKKLAVLFMLDVDKNGKFSLDDLNKFADWCGSVTEHLKSDQQSFKSELQAQCTLHMWKQINTARNGRQVFGDWFVRLFSVGRVVKVAKYPKTHWVSIDTASVIHELLSIKELYGISCQQLIDLMQSVGEEKGLMSLDDEQLDEIIPTEVIHDFAVAFINGFLNMMSSLGFSPEKYLTSNTTNNTDVKVETTDQKVTSSPVLVDKPVEDTKPVPTSLSMPKLNVGVTSTSPVPPSFKLSIPTTALKGNTPPNTTNNDTKPTSKKIEEEYSSDEDDFDSSDDGTKTETASKPAVPSLSLKLGSMGNSINLSTSNVVPSLKLNSSPSPLVTEDKQTSQPTANNGLPFSKLSIPLGKLNLPNSSPASSSSPSPGTPKEATQTSFKPSPPLSIPNNSMKTLSPNASAFLFTEQNNLEKLGELKGDLSDDDLTDNNEGSSNSESDDDIDIASPRKTPPIHPALLQQQQQPVQKPKIPTLSTVKPTEDNDKVQVNGIAMRKLKL